MSFSDLMLFALSSNQELAQRVSREMGLPLGKSTVRQFSDGEIQVNIEESIRGKDVYILQSTSSPVNKLSPVVEKTSTGSFFCLQPAPLSPL